MAAKSPIFHELYIDLVWNLFSDNVRCKIAYKLTCHRKFRIQIVEQSQKLRHPRVQIKILPHICTSDLRQQLLESIRSKFFIFFFLNKNEILQNKKNENTTWGMAEAKWAGLRPYLSESQIKKKFPTKFPVKMCAPTHVICSIVSGPDGSAG